MSNTMHKAIKAHFRDLLTEHSEIDALASMTLCDLYYGNACDDSYPGFTTAIATLSTWVSEHISPVYYGPDTEYVFNYLPQGYEDDCTWCEGASGNEPDAEDGTACRVCRGATTVWHEPESYYEVSVREIVAILFGKELAEYIP